MNRGLVAVQRLARRIVGLPIDAKHEMVERAVNAVNSWQVKGDYLEFGLYEGRSFTYAYNALQRPSSMNRRLFGFDSFKGLPQPLLEEGTSKFWHGQYSCSREEVESKLTRNGVDLNSIHLIEGFFDQTLTEECRDALGLEAAAVVWIDCDLYSSTVDVLDFITPLVRTGSILCFDDYLSYGTDPTKGELRAVREWIERADSTVTLTVYRDFGTSGRSFIVHRESTAKTDGAESGKVPRTPLA